MIELIFVIVILGILASVAIPRLAATREDAEISTTIANLRTLVSEASSYYGGHGKFNTGAGGAGVPWNEVTNVPLRTATNGDLPAGTTVNTLPNGTANGAYITAGKLPCIGVQLVNRATRTGGGFTPAHIKFIQHPTNVTGDPVCAQVRASAPIAAYFNSTVDDGTETGIANAIPVGSSKGIY